MSICITGQYNVTYLHIPKTAGTSLLDWLRTNKKDSTSVEWETHPKHSVISNNHPTFTVVRNPWDRMVSAYHYLKNISLPEGSSWLALNKITAENFPTFEEWVYSLEEYKNPEVYWFRPETPQAEWIDVPVNLILRYETLQQDFKQIQEMFDCPLPLPHHYNSGRGHYKDYYSDSTRKLVERLSQLDIDTWKYVY